MKSFTDDVDPSIELRASKPETASPEQQLDLIPTHEDSPAPANAGATDEKQDSPEQETPFTPAKQAKVESPRNETPPSKKVLPRLDEVREVISQTAKKNPKEFE